MLGYLSADIICSQKRTVFWERSSRKTVSFEEQIMSKDKYPSIFSQPNWGYCVYYPSVLKIGEYPWIFASFSWGIFAHVTRLDQSCASENIWWIIIWNIHHAEAPSSTHYVTCKLFVFSLMSFPLTDSNTDSYDLKSYFIFWGNQGPILSHLTMCI